MPLFPNEETKEITPKLIRSVRERTGVMLSPSGLRSALSLILNCLKVYDKRDRPRTPFVYPLPYILQPGIVPDTILWIKQ